MIFWESSALVALLVEEPASKARLQQLQEDTDAAVWWAAPVECESALQRRLREKHITPAGADIARNLLLKLSGNWLEVPPSPELRRLALRLLRTHSLRAADALQLAGALTLAAGGLEYLRFACADARLNQAATTENLIVLE